MAPAADGNQAAFDLAVRYAVYIERYKTGAVNRLLDFLIELDAENSAQLAVLLDRLSEADKAAFLRNKNSKTQRLLALRDYLQEMRSSAREVLINRTIDEVTPIAERVASRNAAIAAQVGVTAAMPKVSQLERLVRTEPFQGAILKEWASEWSEARVSRVTKSLRVGLALGESVDNLTRRLRGTAVSKFTDGVLNTSRRSASTIVRTAANHARSIGDVEFARANESKIDYMLRRSALDTRTSDICRVNDGKKYSPDEAEGVLPAHPNCRSVFITIWKGQGRPDDDDYFDWLRKQPRDVQDEALGATKAKLFRDGGLTGGDLIKAATGRPYTLDELRRREAEAFEKAGVE